MNLEHTRAMVDAAAAGELRVVPMRRHQIFNLDVPLTCPGVPSEVLDPQSTWSEPENYEVKARELARMFADNFDRFQSSVPPEVTKAGPAAD
jgi:phosphoenolpyruvate carboxykinase (ATP)